MYNCPVCGKEAKTIRGLRKHMSGGRAYGGHDLNEHNIDIMLAGTSARTEVSTIEDTGFELPPPSEHSNFFGEDNEKYGEGPFVELILRRLMKFKSLPKFQFERRIDAFITMFLPQILSAHFGGETELVCPEFPVKKEDSNQSTNADYLLYQKPEGADSGRWILAELKTDEGSVGDGQLSVYRNALKTGMKTLIESIADIRNASAKREKYDRLIKLLSPYPSDCPLEVVYLMIVNGGTEYLSREYPEFTFIGTDELMKFESEKFPHEWDLFRSIVLKR